MIVRVNKDEIRDLTHNETDDDSERPEHVVVVVVFGGGGVGKGERLYAGCVAGGRTRTSRPVSSLWDPRTLRAMDSDSDRALRTDCLLLM